MIQPPHFSMSKLGKLFAQIHKSILLYQQQFKAFCLRVKSAFRQNQSFILKFYLQGEISLSSFNAVYLANN